MNALDILILAVVLAGFVKGLMCGFFRQVVSIVGFLAGLWVAFMLYSALGDWIAPYIGSDVSVGHSSFCGLGFRSGCRCWRIC